MREERVPILEQSFGCVEFLHLAHLQDHDFVRGDDGVDAMGDCDDSGVAKLLMNQSLYGELSFYVDVGSGFIHYDDLALLQEGSADAKNLSFSRTQVRPILLNLHLNSFGIQLVDFAESRSIADLTEFEVSELANRVQVVLQSTLEQHRILNQSNVAPT